MPEPTNLADAFNVLVDAYSAATDPRERRMYLRACLRQLQHESERIEHEVAGHVERLRMVVIASVSEPGSERGGVQS